MSFCEKTRLPMEGEQDAPWSVEVPGKEIPRLLGPEDATLKRLCRATGCSLEVERKRKKCDEDDDDSAPVKVFIRGAAPKRQMAFEVLKAVGEGADPEDHAARAEGAIILPHDMQHPERECWARWRLVSAAHAFSAKAHLGRYTCRLTSFAGGPFKEKVAEQLETAAKDIVSEAFKLAELKVDALDELEPETAGDDPAVTPLVEQHGVIIRVCDQDDNALCETIAVRIIGPAAPAQDAASVLSARFIDGKVTACVLQVLNQVQNMTPEMAKDFAGDLQEMETECKVKVHKGRSALWVCGDEEEQVAEARKMLQEMLAYYLPSEFQLQQDVSPSTIERMRGDEDLGVLMAMPDCAVMLDEPTKSVWICGKQRQAVQDRIKVLGQLPPFVAEGEDGEHRAMKKRRTNNLSFSSELVG